MDSSTKRLYDKIRDFVKANEIIFITPKSGVNNQKSETIFLVKSESDTNNKNRQLKITKLKSRKV